MKGTDRRLLPALALGAALFCGETRAGDLNDIEVHAFLSQGFIKTTDNNYIVRSHLGSFDLTECGINFTKQLDDRFRVGMQLFARRPSGPTNSFSARFDWIYADYRFSDWLGLRFGRIKIPFGLYNDTSDIDAARVPVLLPQSVYPTQNRDVLLAQTGAEAYGYTGTGAAGALEYRLYAGTIAIDTNNLAGDRDRVREVHVPFLVGGRLLWDTPFEGLRAGATVQALRMDTSQVFGATSTTIVTGQIPATLWVASTEYTRHDLSLSAEYSRWYFTTGNTSNPVLFPSLSLTSERAYVMGSYRVNSWLQPALYYSVLYPNVEARAGKQNQLHDLSATLRFDINRYWLLKAEAHYLSGTAGLQTPLNGGVPSLRLQEHWGTFLLKTTAYF